MTNNSSSVSFAPTDLAKIIATEGARGALAVGFERIGLPEIVSFTTIGNLRSRAVMERIGMSNANEDFEHPGVPEGSVLRLHCLYRLQRAEWSKKCLQRGLTDDGRPPS